MLNSSTTQSIWWWFCEIAKCTRTVYIYILYMHAWITFRLFVSMHHVVAHHCKTLRCICCCCCVFLLKDTINAYIYCVCIQTYDTKVYVLCAHHQIKCFARNPLKIVKQHNISSAIFKIGFQDKWMTTKARDCKYTSTHLNVHTHTLILTYFLILFFVFIFHAQYRERRLDHINYKLLLISAGIASENHMAIQINTNERWKELRKNIFAYERAMASSRLNTHHSHIH